MPSLLEHQFHQNINYTSKRGNSIHINKNSSIGLKNFFTLWCCLVTMGDVLYAQQSSDIREGHLVMLRTS